MLLQRVIFVDNYSKPTPKWHWEAEHNGLGLCDRQESLHETENKLYMLLS